MSAGIIHKMLVLKDDKETAEQWIMPEGMSGDRLQQWIDRLVKKAEEKNKLRGRFQGRTWREDWDIPFKYMPISSNSAADREFDVGVEICSRILEQGRLTLKEIMYEFGALDPEVITIAFNGLLLHDHYLKKYKEEDGTDTYELIEKSERASMMGLPPPKKPELVHLSPALPDIKPEEKGEDKSGGEKV